MEISKAISGIADAVGTVREEIRKIADEISVANQKRHAIMNAAPHADDIVALFMSGLDHAGGDFKRQFSSHLLSRFVSDGSAERVASGRLGHLLNLDSSPPPQSFTQARNGPAPLNMAVLAYFLRDRIKAELPALVGSLCPASLKGMKAADRAAALADVDMEIERLEARKAALEANLAAARAAVFPQA
ncbi:MAG: hypothetical protein ABI673_02575 [Novosphingobium sp.]